MQRLFSTFAGGWPGAGLLLQRVLACALLSHTAIIHPHSMAMVPHLVGSVAGFFLLAGLWTPLAGTLIAVAEAWAILSGTPEPWISAAAATLGASLAMIGPGASSVDARVFGRKRIETGDY